MGMACGHLIISLSVVIHFLEGPFMDPSLGQVVEVFHGEVAVAESSEAGEGSVVGSRKWLHGATMDPASFLFF